MASGHHCDAPNDLGPSKAQVHGNSIALLPMETTQRAVTKIVRTPKLAVTIVRCFGANDFTIRMYDNHAFFVRIEAVLIARVVAHQHRVVRNIAQ